MIKRKCTGHTVTVVRQEAVSILKKGATAILVLSLLLSAHTVIPALAKGTFSTNMEEWRKVTGEWDFDTGEAKSTVSNNQAVCKTAVSSEDNWMWNMDITYTDEREDTGHYYYLRFGYKADNGPYYFLQICPTAASNQIALYYFDENAATKNTRISGWMAFPEGSDTSQFNVRMSVTNKVWYLFIDGTYLGQVDISSSFSGGYFGLANNKFAARFDNVNLYVNEDGIDVYAGYFCSSENGYKTFESTRRWNQAHVSTELKGKYFVLEADYKNNGGNNQSYVRFGMQDEENYYYLNMQPDNTTASFSIYGMTEGTAARKSAWVAGPAGYDKDNFHIQLIVTPDRCKVYIDHTLILECAVGFDGGIFGLATYYTAAEFNNLSITRGIIRQTAAIKAGGGAYQTESGATFLDTGWGRAAMEVSSDQNVTISVDVSKTGTNMQYYLYFGATASNSGDGYSVRLQLAESTGENNIVVYDNATNKRVSAWRPFPDESADRNKFTVTLKYLSGIARVYIDGQYILSTGILTPAGSYTEFVTYRSLGTVSNLVVSTPEILFGDVTADDVVDGKDLDGLRKGLTDADYVVDLAAADCNLDGTVNIKDLVRLKKYRSGEMLSIENNMVLINSWTEESCSYAETGSFRPEYASSDFDTEYPYVYLVKGSSNEFENGTISQSIRIGVYGTSDYIIRKVGIIIASGNYTANASELTADSTDANVTKTDLPVSGSFDEYKVQISGLPWNSSRTMRAYIELWNDAGESIYLYSTDCCFFGQAG